MKDPLWSRRALAPLLPANITRVLGALAQLFEAQPAPAPSPSPTPAEFITELVGVMRQKSPDLRGDALGCRPVGRAVTGWESGVSFLAVLCLRHMDPPSLD